MLRATRVYRMVLLLSLLVAAAPASYAKEDSPEDLASLMGIGSAGPAPRGADSIEACLQGVRQALDAQDYDALYELLTPDSIHTAALSGLFLAWSNMDASAEDIERVNMRAQRHGVDLRAVGDYLEEEIFLPMARLSRHPIYTALKDLKGLFKHCMEMKNARVRILIRGLIDLPLTEQRSINKLGNFARCYVGKGDRQGEVLLRRIKERWYLQGASWTAPQRMWTEGRLLAWRLRSLLRLAGSKALPKDSATLSESQLRSLGAGPLLDTLHWFSSRDVRVESLDPATATFRIRLKSSHKGAAPIRYLEYALDSDGTEWGPSETLRLPPPNVKKDAPRQIRITTGSKSIEKRLDRLLATYVGHHPGSLRKAFTTEGPKSDSELRLLAPGEETPDSARAFRIGPVRSSLVLHGSVKFERDNPQFEEAMLKLLTGKGDARWFESKWTKELAGKPVRLLASKEWPELRAGLRKHLEGIAEAFSDEPLSVFEEPKRPDVKLRTDWELLDTNAEVLDAVRKDPLAIGLLVEAPHDGTVRSAMPAFTPRGPRFALRRRQGKAYSHAMRSFVSFLISPAGQKLLHPRGPHTRMYYAPIAEEMFAVGR